MALAAILNQADILWWGVTPTPTVQYTMTGVKPSVGIKNYVPSGEIDSMTPSSSIFSTISKPSGRIKSDTPGGSISSIKPSVS